MRIKKRKSLMTLTLKMRENPITKTKILTMRDLTMRTQKKKDLTIMKKKDLIMKMKKDPTMKMRKDLTTKTPKKKVPTMKMRKDLTTKTPKKKDPTMKTKLRKKVQMKKMTLLSLKRNYKNSPMKRNLY
jgi:hypothetical protein